jgi:hypothetical protein
MSNIITNNLDVTYPIAGQDNDTQGFRDNWNGIQSNFITAYNEITALQTNVGIVQTTFLPSYTGNLSAGNISVGNVYAGNITLNTVIQLANLTQTQISTISPSPGMLVYNNTYGNIQGYSTHLGRWGNITLS